jgi:hypothetical protein
MTLSVYVHIQTNDSIQFMCEVILSSSTTFSDILHTNLIDYVDSFEKVYCLNSDTTFNLSDTIINSIQPSDNIIYVLKTDQ